MLFLGCQAPPWAPPCGNDLQGTIQEMLQSGEAMPVPKGTRCNIVKIKLSRCQVKLVDGEHAGESVWIVIEAVKR